MARASTNGSTKDVSVQDLTDQIETLRKDLSDLTTTMADMGKAKKAQLADAAAQQVETARQKGIENRRYAGQPCPRRAGTSQRFCKIATGHCAGYRRWGWLSGRFDEHAPLI